MNKSVLIADKATVSRGVIKYTLEGAGYKVIGEADNGDELVEKYNHLAPEFIMLNLSIFHNNEISSITNFIKSNKHRKIIITGCSKQRQHIFDALEAGAKYFIQKPITPLKLLQVFREVEILI